MKRFYFQFLQKSGRGQFCASSVIEAVDLAAACTGLVYMYGDYFAGERPKVSTNAEALAWAKDPSNKIVHGAREVPAHLKKPNEIRHYFQGEDVRGFPA